MDSVLIKDICWGKNRRFFFLRGRGGLGWKWIFILTFFLLSSLLKEAVTYYFHVLQLRLCGNEVAPAKLVTGSFHMGLRIFLSLTEKKWHETLFVQKVDHASVIVDVLMLRGMTVCLWITGQCGKNCCISLKHVLCFVLKFWSGA